MPLQACFYKLNEHSKGLRAPKQGCSSGNNQSKGLGAGYCVLTGSGDPDFPLDPLHEHRRLPGGTLLVHPAGSLE